MWESSAVQEIAEGQQIFRLDKRDEGRKESCDWCHIEGTDKGNGLDKRKTEEYSSNKEEMVPKKEARLLENTYR